MSRKGEIGTQRREAFIILFNKSLQFWFAEIFFAIAKKYFTKKLGFGFSIGRIPHKEEFFTKEKDKANEKNNQFISVTVGDALAGPFRTCICGRGGNRS